MAVATGEGTKVDAQAAWPRTHFVEEVVTTKNTDAHSSEIMHETVVREVDRTSLVIVLCANLFQKKKKNAPTSPATSLFE